MDDTIKFMQRLDREYREISGLSERRYYSIFYSRIEQCTVLVLGFNPGGNPENWNEETELASRKFYENREHEYVDCHYPIAVAMREFLLKVLALDGVNRIRRIPKTNIIFRRSPSQDKMKLRESKAIQEAKPVLEQILRRVSPSVIICEGIETLKKFEKYYCKDVEEEVDGENVSTPNGRNMARIYRADQARVIPIDSSALLLGIGHPSKYSKRKEEWARVIELSKQIVGRALDSNLSGITL